MLNFSRGINKSGVARHLIIYVVLFSSFITLLSTAMQLYRDYNNDINLIEGQLQQAQDVHLKALTATLWASDARELKTHLEGISQLRDMQFLEVRDQGKVWVSVGTPQSENVMSRQYPMVYTHRGRDLEIGTLTVVASLSGVYQRLIDKVWVILISNGIKTFLVAGFILIIFYTLITRHLIRIADFAHTLGINRLDKLLVLDRKRHRKQKKDELDLVVDAINQMQVNIGESFTALEQSEDRARLQVTALKVAADGIVITDRDGAIQWVNPAYTRLTGYKFDEVLGQNLRILKSGKQDPAFYKHLWDTILSGNTWYSELVNKRKDGSLYPEEESITPVMDDKGAITHFVASKRDITERKQAEEAQHAHIRYLESMQRIADVIASAPAPDELLRGVITCIREIFQSDRASLVYPCDPEAATWSVPIEVTVPDFPGVFATGVEVPLDADAARIMRDALDAQEPIVYCPMPKGVDWVKQFSIRSQMVAAIRPRFGKPWLLGMHQCTHEREWTVEEQSLFKEIALRLTDVLSATLLRRELRTSEERLKFALEGANDGLWDIDLHSGEAYYSPRYQSMLGFEPGELPPTQEAWEQLIHPDDTERVKKHFQQHLTGDTEYYQAEYRARTKDGLWRWILARGKVVEWDETGAPVRAVGTHTDITERRQAEDIQRRQHEGLAKLDEWVRRLILPTGQVHDFYDLVSAGIRDLVGADLGALPLIDESGKTFTYVAVAGQKADMIKGRSLPLEGGGLCGWVVTHGESLCVGNLTEDPRVIQDLVQVLDVTTGLLTPLRKEDKVIGGLSAFRNGEPFDYIDEQLLNLFSQRVSVILDNLYLRLSLERRVAERTVALEMANQELEAFSYSVSHDLRAPLRSIDGFSQAILEDYADKLDSKGQDYLRRVRTGAQRMGELIDDLLTLSRVTRREMHRNAIDLSQLARNTAAQIKEQQPDCMVNFTIEAGQTARGDPHLLRIVLENLLGNAWKYSSKEARAHIEFGVMKTDGKPVYYVRDNGVGFDMKYADKLFGAFQRLHKAEEFEGTGIGLATVARIIHRHGGRVWAEGEVGKGATFYFTLAEKE